MTAETKTRQALIEAAIAFLTGNETIETANETFVDMPILANSLISWENKNFDSSGKPIWASVFYRPNIPQAASIGFGGSDNLNGFLQIDINVPLNSGEGELIRWREKSRLFFFGGKTFESEGHSVLVISAGMTQPRNVENNFRESLTVAFRSRLKRTKL